MQERSELHLRVYADRSVLITSDGTQEEFVEGTPSAAAKDRLSRIRAALADGYLPSMIERVRIGRAIPTDIDPDHLALLERLVGSVTSEVGRALVGLSVLLLAIKDIEPNQSIRLHKAGRGGFSWREGVPMRNLDSEYVTPVLREYDLLRVNADGVMMTRSLAENYPYSLVYKAAIRGARGEWLTLIDTVETGGAAPRQLLEALLGILLNRSQRFRTLAEDVISKTAAFIGAGATDRQIFALVTQHTAESSYSARLLEVAMHSVFQVLSEQGVLPGRLAPLSQMRSANKKHGNVGDIEVVKGSSNRQVIEAWDAKYGKPYLRDELEELSDKLENHAETVEVGFVVDRDPDLRPDILGRKLELEQIHGATIHLLSFTAWVDMQVSRSGMTRLDFMRQWLQAYVESLALRRRDMAPIDEPAEVWLEFLRDLL